MKLFLKKYLSDEELKAVAAKITEAERNTSGEIRVSIRHSRSLNERKLSLHELALKEFTHLNMQKTAGRTGVLILLLMSERKFHVIADEGIHKKVQEGAWDRIAESMSTHFRAGNFSRGICDAVDAVGAELKKHFPSQTNNRDELPNDVIER